jgi:hypothetical protein
MPPGIPEGAMCVQRFDDSLNSAIHITYRISLRSSSMPEPRDPLLKVLYNLYGTQTTLINRVWVSSDGHTLAEASGGLMPYGPPKQQGHINMGWRVARRELSSL